MALSRPVEWRIDNRPVGYRAAVAAMEERAGAVRRHGAAELVWLLEHPPLYTAGTSADAAELLAPGRFPVFRSGRGGRYTYHGPGQRIAYAVIDLRARGLGIRDYVCGLEEWLIRTAARFGLAGERREGRIGVWVRRGGAERKIAALGVRVRRWVAFHGVALNVAPDLGHFDGIVPCGIEGFGVTSLAAEGVAASMPEVDAALRACFGEVFDAAPRRR